MMSTAAYNVLEGAGPLGATVKPSQVFRLFKYHKIHSSPSNAIHRISNRYYSQQQFIIPPSIEGNLEVRGDSCNKSPS